VGTTRGEGLRIRAWEKLLGDQARGKTGALKWFMLPARLTDPDLVRLLDMPNGRTHLGIFELLIKLAGSMEARDGRLCRGDGTPLTIREMAPIIRCPAAELEEAIEALKEVRWLIPDPLAQSGAECAIVRQDADSGAECALEERKRRGEEKERSEEERRSTEASLRSASRAATTAQVDEVCAHYREHHPRARPGEKERKLVRARLKKWSVDELKAAIDGCHRSPHHCGENDRGAKYQGLALICRDDGHVQQFLEVPDMTPSDRAIKNRRVGDNWLALRGGCDRAG